MTKVKYKIGEWVKVFNAEGEVVTALYDGRGVYSHRVKVQLPNGSWRTWYLQEDRFVR